MVLQVDAVADWHGSFTCGLRLGCLRAAPGLPGPSRAARRQRARLLRSPYSEKWKCRGGAEGCPSPGEGRAEFTGLKYEAYQARSGWLLAT